MEKLECVDHVQKHLSSRLCSLKKRLGKNRLEGGKPIGGKGRLTDKVIDKLQVYYGKAIRQNTHSVHAMQNAIMAIWHHSKSTEDNPDHDLCPEGENLWCGFQKDTAKGTLAYIHKDPIPEAVANAILPTFEAQLFYAFTGLLEFEEPMIHRVGDCIANLTKELLGRFIKLQSIHEADSFLETDYTGSTIQVTNCQLQAENLYKAKTLKRHSRCAISI